MNTVSSPVQPNVTLIPYVISNRGTKGSEFIEIRYNRILNCFQIVNARATMLTNAELFVVAKIILRCNLSREFSAKNYKSYFD